ncbi:MULTISPECIES: hypothetical protein [unclassified Rhizobium]|uniref:hypothetical protein n=1 Tax=unclassified Rhizobium TaxID=2613769 RepID=UPI001ADCDDFA|nr:MULTISPECIES: hypothetical protein [unclassified Rhizobium]MBO9100763.1 hypothetical protein [Rhizobium sp. L58/93]MBO9135873.1 hypothetical protein [Rhizobium sp. B209b/85]MBO9171185.1 hypothetical protein [Rhizobium sp. L245/93]MBO9187054.1 hypothetical protein [Rhizobium sp. E27B/91]QXZ88030.1 hypothetical protein J5287_29115 [Rhizobium sp. K1/93]
MDIAIGAAGAGFGPRGNSFETDGRIGRDAGPHRRIGGSFCRVQPLQSVVNPPLLKGETDGGRAAVPPLNVEDCRASGYEKMQRIYQGDRSRV